MNLTLLREGEVGSGDPREARPIVQPAFSLVAQRSCRRQSVDRLCRGRPRWVYFLSWIVMVTAKLESFGGGGCLLALLTCCAHEWCVVSLTVTFTMKYFSSCY